MALGGPYEKGGGASCFGEIHYLVAARLRPLYHLNDSLVVGREAIRWEMRLYGIEGHVPITSDRDTFPHRL